jgi:hypothetical protein
MSDVNFFRNFFSNGGEEKKKIKKEERKAFYRRYSHTPAASRLTRPSLKRGEGNLKTLKNKIPGTMVYGIKNSHLFCLQGQKR